MASREPLAAEVYPRECGRRGTSGGEGAGPRPRASISGVLEVGALKARLGAVVASPSRLELVVGLGARGVLAEEVVVAIGER